MTATRQLPTGTVTFFFSDVEDSTGLLQRLALAAFRDVIEHHADIIRDRLAVHHGVEVRTDGDGFFAVFTQTEEALGAASDIQQRLAAADVRQRIGPETPDRGSADRRYFGIGAFSTGIC